MVKALLTVAVLFSAGTTLVRPESGSISALPAHPLHASEATPDRPIHKIRFMRFGAECINRDAPQTEGAVTEEAWPQSLISQASPSRNQGANPTKSSPALRGAWVDFVAPLLVVLLALTAICLWTYSCRDHRRTAIYDEYLQMRLDDLVSAKARDEHTIEELCDTTRLLEGQLRDALAARADDRETIAKLSEATRELSKQHRES
jgi:hypothetical protein